MFRCVRLSGRRRRQATDDQVDVQADLVFDDTEQLTGTDVTTSLQEVLITDNALENVPGITEVVEDTIAAVGT